MKFLTKLYDRINLFFKQDNFKYIFIFIVLAAGLLLTIFYWYIEYKYKSTNGIMLIKSGAILIFFAVAAEYILSSIKHYSTFYDEKISEKRFLIEREVDDIYKIQKMISLIYIMIGTFLCGFGDVIYNDYFR